MKFAPDLKPCPFCGSTHLAYGVYAVHCGNCSAAGPFGETEEKAVELWNKRVGRLADCSHMRRDTVDFIQELTRPKPLADPADKHKH